MSEGATWRIAELVILVSAIVGYIICKHILKKMEAEEVGYMGRTSNEVKARWNKKANDEFLVRMPKGQKEELKAACAAKGISMNAFFKGAIDAFLHGNK